MRARTLRIVSEHNARWAAGDLRGLFALYHPEMVFSDHYTGKRYTHEALRGHIAAVIARSALDSILYTDRIRVDGDTATLRYREAIRSANGDILLVVNACDVVRVQGEAIVAIDEYALPEALAPTPVSHARAALGRGNKIGLSARAVGHLLADIDHWARNNQGLLEPSLSLQHVAAATGYTRNQISFALNQVRGVGFFAWLHRERVRHLLQHIPVPAHGGVLAWSEQAGFRSASTFYKAFRAVTGQSPAQWLQAGDAAHSQP